MVSFEPFIVSFELSCDEPRTIQNGLPKHKTAKWLFRHQLGRKTSFMVSFEPFLEHIHKYPQSVAGERAGGLSVGLSVGKKSEKNKNNHQKRQMHQKHQFHQDK